MPRYCVTLPVTGYCVVEVEADTSEHAIEKAHNMASADNLETWETHNEICTGNVCHAQINEAHAEKVED